MLAWLVDIVNTYDVLDPASIAFPVDFESPINMSKSRFSTIVDVARCDEMSDEAEACFEVCKDFIFLMYSAVY